MSGRQPFVSQELAEFEALNTQLRRENELLHERLAACRQLNETLCAWGNGGWRRVAELADENERLKHRGGRKRVATESDEVNMMIRYVELGGLERGKGDSAKMQVAAEFACSKSTVERLVAKYRRVTVRAPAHQKAPSKRI